MATTSTPGTRDPSQIPFSSTSIWNLPLGTGAQWQYNGQLAGAGIYVNTNGNYNQPIYTSTASDPLVTVTSDGSWGGGAGTWTLHIPAGAEASAPYGGDMHLAVDDTSTNTWYSFGGFTWTSATTATAKAGSGEPDNGSGLQDTNGNWDFGVGTLRASDLATGTINHMLRIDVPTTMLYSWDPTSVYNLAPYAWPNTMEDGFANGAGIPPGLTAYSGTIPYGVTIGIPQGVAEPANVAANAGADMLWRALQTHGAMVRDSTAPYGNNIVLKTDQGVDQSNPLIQDMEQFGNAILSHAEIMTNQGPASVNGGGTPVVALDPPLSDATTTSSGGSTSTGTGSTTSTTSATYITPGSGSFKDAAGNSYTLSTANVAMENGSPIPGGTGTAEMAYANGTVYGEDRSSSQWYTWNQSTWAPAAAPPASSSGTSSSGTGSSTPPASGGTGSSTPPATGGTGGTPPATGGTGGTTTAYITPGTGSFKDAAGNTYTLDAAGNAMENGSPIPGGSGTKEMAYFNGTVYGEDGSTSQWYTWNQSTWSATTAPPPASGGSTTSGTGSGTPPAVTGAGSDSLVIKVSEDAYKGDAQFTVQIDGKQLGGTFTATTPHSSGNSQAFAFAGDFGAGSHTVTVTFLNDLYAGTASTDRNLYVNDVIYKGVDTGKSAALLAAGSKAFAVTGGTTPSVAETSDHGSLTKNLSQTGTYKVGGDTFVLTSGNAATVTLGTGTSQIKFLGAGSVTLTGGSGQATVSSDLGNNSFVAGTGSLDVTGGAGKDAYTYHATSGMLVVEDFSLAKGDTLTIDKSLQGSFHQGSDGTGGSMLTFGSASHGIDLHGVATFASSNVHWV